jgi:hypothetical protein
MTDNGVSFRSRRYAKALRLLEIKHLRTKPCRRGHAIEIDPLYVDVAVRRWQRYSGKPGRLDSSGTTFKDIAEQRSTSSPASIAAGCSMKQQNG